MIFLLLSCKDTSLYTLQNHDFVEEQKQFTPLDASLSKPTKMTHYQDGIWIIDEESYLVHHYDISQAPIESYSFESMESLKFITSKDDLLLLATEMEMFQFESNNWTSIANSSESISHIAIYKNHPAYVINRENASSIHINSLVLEIPFIQDSISIYDDHWYALHRDGQKMYDIMIDPELGTSTISEIYIFDDIPHQMIQNQNTFFLTTRSFRWPYAGWIVGLEDNDEVLVERKISETPPEPEWIGATDTYIYWGSKQSITRVNKEGGTFEMIASQTTVGNLIIVNDSVWWTDTKGGRIFVFTE